MPNTYRAENLSICSEEEHREENGGKKQNKTKQLFELNRDGV